MSAVVLDEGQVHCLKCSRLVRWATVAVDYTVAIDINCLWCGTYRQLIDSC